MNKPKERYKITIKDEKTGEKQIYHVYSLGFTTRAKVGPNGVEVVRMVLEYPRIEVKTKTNK